MSTDLHRVEHSSPDDSEHAADERNLGFGRTVVSETAAPNVLVDLV